MKGYKGFSKGLVCRGKQYAENTVFEESEAVVCESGMHFCKEPLDVLDYYPMFDENGEMNEFAEVEALEEPVTEDGKKFCTKKLKIGAKIDFTKLVQASVNFEYEKISDKETEVKTTSNDFAQICSSENCAKISSSGDYAELGSSGDYAKIGSSGDLVRISSSGDSAKIGSSGKFTKIGSSGNSVQIGSSGNSVEICSSGDYAKICSSGHYAKISSSGYHAKISSSGYYAVICCAGRHSKVKAKQGSCITLSEWKYDKDKKAFAPVCVRTEQVDGERIKEDTYYMLVDGQFTEVHG